MSTSENVQSYIVGKSDYAKHAIQPWDIWKEYNLNPWDADIVKRVLRSKEGEARTLDYEKIIHICKYRIAELSKEVLKETKVVTPAEEEKPVEDEESDDTTVFCLDETMKPAMFYIEGEEWNGKYVGYSVFMTGNAPYMYLGVNAEGTVTDDGHLLRYFGMEGDMFYYRNMSEKRADGTYPEFLSKYKLENKAIQFTL